MLANKLFLELDLELVNNNDVVVMLVGKAVGVKKGAGLMIEDNDELGVMGKADELEEVGVVLCTGR